MHFHSVEMVCMATVVLLALRFFLWLLAIREKTVPTKLSELKEEKDKVL
jgi:hypothetical protein